MNPKMCVVVIKDTNPFLPMILAQIRLGFIMGIERSLLIPPYQIILLSDRRASVGQGFVNIEKCAKEEESRRYVVGKNYQGANNLTESMIVYVQ